MQDENKARTKQAGRIEVAELAKGVLGRPLHYPDGTPVEYINNRAAARELREWLTLKQSF